MTLILNFPSETVLKIVIPSLPPVLYLRQDFVAIKIEVA